MDHEIKDFTNYLFDIGIVDVDSAKDFLETFNQFKFKKANNIKSNEYSLDIDDIFEKEQDYYFKDSIVRAIFHYLDKMSEGQKRILSLNLFRRYQENKTVEMTRKAKNMFLIYSKYFKQNSQTMKKFKIQKWKKFSEIFLISSSNMSRLLNSRSFNETSTMRKEREELRHCTFQPKINNNYLTYNEKNFNSIPIHERLYSDYERGKQRKVLKMIEYDKKESELASFSPNISMNSYKRNVNKTNFFDRQENFTKSKGKNRERIVKDIEHEMNGKFPFSPKILKKTKYLRKNKNSASENHLGNSENFSNLTNLTNYISKPNSRSNSKSNYVNNSNFESTPAYVRLYEENARRKRNNHLKNFEMDYKENLNFSSDNKNLNNSKISKMTTRQSHNYTLQNLYDDHKKNQIHKKQLQKNLDQEQGITFKPKFISNSQKYEPKYNFDDRNKKLLEDKKKIVEIFNQINEENFNNQRIVKQVNANDYEEITKEAGARLYVKGLEKMLKRNFNPNEDIKTTKKIRTNSKPKIKVDIHQYIKEKLDELNKKENEKLKDSFSQENIRESYSKFYHPSENIESDIEKNLQGKRENINFNNLNTFNQNSSKQKSEKNSYKENSNKNSASDGKKNNEINNLQSSNSINNIITNTMKNTQTKDKFISFKEYTFGKEFKSKNNEKRIEYNFTDDFYADKEENLNNQEISRDLKFEENEGVVIRRKSNKANEEDFLDIRNITGLDQDNVFRSNSMKIFMESKNS